MSLHKCLLCLWSIHLPDLRLFEVLDWFQVESLTGRANNNHDQLMVRKAGLPPLFLFPASSKSLSVALPTLLECAPDVTQNLLPLMLQRDSQRLRHLSELRPAARRHGDATAWFPRAALRQKSLI